MGNTVVKKTYMGFVHMGFCCLVTKPCPTLETLWTVACQVPLSLEFSRQEYLSGLPFSSPGDLPDPSIEPVSLALAGRFFTTELSVKPSYEVYSMNCFTF